MNSTTQQPQESQQPLKPHEPGFWDFHNQNKTK
jgi:hypothetical protein